MCLPSRSNDPTYGPHPFWPLFLEERDGVSVNLSLPSLCTSTVAPSERQGSYRVIETNTMSRISWKIDRIPDDAYQSQYPSYDLSVNHGILSFSIIVVCRNVGL